MFDAQTSALTAEMTDSLNALVPAGRDSRRLRHRGRGVLSLLPGVVALPPSLYFDAPSRARPRANILSPYRALIMRLPPLLHFGAARRQSRRQVGRPQEPFKIKNLQARPSEKPSNPIKPNQGFLMKKIPNFFQGTFLGNHW